MHSIFLGSHIIPPKLEQWCGYLWSAQGGPGQVLEVSHSARLLSLNEQGGKKEQQNKE